MLYRKPKTVFIVPHQARPLGDIFWKCRGLSPRNDRSQAAPKQGNLRIFLKAAAQFASPRPDLLHQAAPKGTLKIENYNYYERLALVTQSRKEDAEITVKMKRLTLNRILWQLTGKFDMSVGKKKHYLEGQFCAVSI